MSSASATGAPAQGMPSKAFLFLIGAGFFMQGLDTTIVNTALPAIAAGLGESPLQMQPVVVAYTLTMAMLIPASGWLADRFGTRQIYFMAILLFALGSLCCAGAQTLPQLIAARVLQGVGGAMLLPIGRLALLRSVAPEQYIAALATVTIAGQIGPLLGPPLGGLLAQSASWPWIFLINVPIALGGLWAVRRFMPAGKLDQAAPSFDAIGFLLVGACMVAFSLALDVPAGEHHDKWATILAAVSVASALLYILHARRRANPLFRLGLFRDRNFGVGLIGNLVCRIGSNAVPFMLPLLLQLQLGFTPLNSGLMLVPAAAGGMLGRRFVSGLVKRFGYHTFLSVNTVIVGLSITAFGLIEPGVPLWLQVLTITIFGASNSMQFAVMNSATLRGLDAADAGSGNSLFSMAQMLATGLGVTIGATLVNVLGSNLGSTAHGFRWAFITLGLVTAVSALIFRRMRSPGSKIVRN